MLYPDPVEGAVGAIGDDGHHLGRIVVQVGRYDAVEVERGGDARVHVAQVEELSAEVELPNLAPWDFKWPGEDSPEGPDIHEAHYLMTPYHAIELALGGELRAAGFYHGVAESAAPAEVRELAARLAAEEDEYVVLLEGWLDRYTEPESGWDEDPDPPNLPE